MAYFRFFMKIAQGASGREYKLEQTAFWFLFVHADLQLY